jgi:3-methylcrotonyl-CoA carboxylase alpha subunit
MRTGVFTVRHGDDEHRVTVTASGEARVDGQTTLTIEGDGRGGVRVRDGERWRQVYVNASGNSRQVFVNGEVYEFVVEQGAAPRARTGRLLSDMVAAPMPAKVTAILVEPGRPVSKGDVLLKLEAMKMELPVRAPRDGVVKTVTCRVGELVQPGVALMELA